MLVCRKKSPTVTWFLDREHMQSLLQQTKDELTESEKTPPTDSQREEDTHTHTHHSEEKMKSMFDAMKKLVEDYEINSTGYLHGFI